MKISIKLLFYVLLIMLSFSLKAEDTLIIGPPLAEQFTDDSVSSIEVKYDGAIVVTFSQNFSPLDPENERGRGQSPFRKIRG